MKEILKSILLFDFYGELLTEKQKDIFKLYYEDDFSLSEIGERHEITKQAVYDLLKRTEKKLEAYEKKLKLIKKFEMSNDKFDEIKEIIDKIENKIKKQNSNISKENLIESIMVDFKKIKKLTMRKEEY